MKLIYIVNLGISAGWAHEIQIMKMCEAFAENEIDVELAVPRRRLRFKDDPFKYYNIETKFKITKLPCLDLCLGSDRSFYFWLRLISFLLSAKIYLFFQKFDILYTRETLAGLFFSAKGGSAPGGKNFFLEIHSLPLVPKKWQIRVWQKAKGLIVLTGLIKKELMDFGISEDKIIIASDAVDIEKFDLKIAKSEARKKINLLQNRKIVMYSGSLYSLDWKGVGVLLDEIKYLPDDYLVVLVGGEKEELKKIEKSYSSEKLLLIGRRPHEEIPYYLKAADVLILPNKKGDATSEKYTSPLKLFEYMASGVPIVASDLPSIREILNENNAVLIESNNPADLAGGIKKILQNPELAEKISRQAIKDVRNFTWDKRAKEIIDFISK
ncbi:MAG: glycosyltransferase family 4 protein [bacterium]|nr:glycosyltransferase family 4 protein [bacterium]